MSPLIVNCWPVFKRVARRVFKHRRPHGLHHHARRAAGIAVSKPAVIGYVCVAVGGIGGAVSIFSPTFVAPKIDTQAIGGGFADIETFGPMAPQFPLLSPGLPPAIGPTLPPETPVTPIPEPGSALLLATALVAAIATIRGRER